MSLRTLHSAECGVLWLAATMVVAACSADAPTEAPHRARPRYQSASMASDHVAICHRTGSGSGQLTVARAALAAHLVHGDYVTTLLVSHESVGASDGIHFPRIGDALGAARAGRIDRGELTEAACRITIDVDSDVYMGTAVGQPLGTVERFPMIVDVPDITLRGALVMRLDEAGRATGAGATDAATVLVSIEPLPTVDGAPMPIIIANSHPDGSAGSGLTVEGFVFRSGAAPPVAPAGQGVLGVRTSGLTIRGNRFERFTEAVDLRASSAEVVQNLAEGTDACDLCLAGPGTYRATGNRILAGAMQGIIAIGAPVLPTPSRVEPYDPPAAAETWVEIRNNEVRDHNRLPAGSAVRVDAVGIGAPNVHNTTHVVIRDNRLAGNRFGITVHAGFPVAASARSSDVDVMLGGNDIVQSCQARMLVGLARQNTALGLANGPYLLNSRFTLSLGGDMSWDDVWYAHPAGFGNTLIVDGQMIANGSRQFYTTQGCPAL